MNKILEQSKEIFEEIVGHRRYFHKNPEVGMILPITTKYVINKLKDMGYEPEVICESGVSATVGTGNSGKTFLLRADMDALEIVEETDEEFKSNNGSMHACGHDLHTSMLLGAAKLLKINEDQIEGTVKLMFQPAEEILSGASAMIEAGILTNPKVDAAMMIHVLSGFPLVEGKILSMLSGINTAAADWFKITINGKGCHGAAPNSGVDPLVVVSQILLSLQNINAREIDPSEPASLTVGQLHGGTAGNIIPDTAFLEGTIRTFSKEARDFIKTRVKEIAENIGKSFRADVKVDFFRGCPSNETDKELRNEINTSVIKLLGEDNLVDSEKTGIFKTMPGSEDFAYISEHIPSVMLFLTAGSTANGYEYPMHHPKVSFDESVLNIGAAVYADTAIEWLKNNQ